MNTERNIAAAREALALGPDVPVRIWPVHRLDRTGESYTLVVFGEANASVGVAAIDSGTSRVLAQAALPGTGVHRVIARAEAVARAGATAGATARLVWAPSPASRSMFYPFWRVESVTGTLFVDAFGQVWPDLNTRGPGG